MTGGEWLHGSPMRETTSVNETDHVMGILDRLGTGQDSLVSGALLHRKQPSLA